MLLFDNEAARIGIGKALGSVADAWLKAANNRMKQRSKWSRILGSR